MHNRAVQCIDWQCCFAHRPDSLEMSAEQAHVHNTGSVSRLLNCTTTEAVSESQTALGSFASSSGAAGSGQPDCEEGVSTSQSMQTGATGSRCEWQAESVGKLFDKELDNHHEEKLLLAQVATGADLHLNSLGRPLLVSVFRLQPLAGWLKAHCSKLLSLCIQVANFGWMAQSSLLQASCPTGHCPGGPKITTHSLLPRLPLLWAAMKKQPDAAAGYRNSHILDSDVFSCCAGSSQRAKSCCSGGQ